jgi:hypothetical protein
VRAIAISFKGNRGHGDGRTFSKPLFQMASYPPALNASPTIILTRSDLAGLVM